jgi:hypothetical protein
MTLDSDERVLFVNSLVGGSLGSAREWAAAVSDITLRVFDAAAGAVSPLIVGVLFQISGETFKADFEGLRTGRYSKATNTLLIQVALPESLPDSTYDFLVEMLKKAIDVAEDVSRKKNLSDGLPAIRSILAQL